MWENLYPLHCSTTHHFLRKAKPETDTCSFHIFGRLQIRSPTCERHGDIAVYLLPSPPLTALSQVLCCTTAGGNLCTREMLGCAVIPAPSLEVNEGYDLIEENTYEVILYNYQWLVCTVPSLSKYQSMPNINVSSHVNMVKDHGIRSSPQPDIWAEL